MLKRYLLENKEAHYRMALSYTKNKEDALDVIQDSIEKALRAIRQNVLPQNLNAWFYKILIRTAIDHVRKRKDLVSMEQEEMEFLVKHEDHYAQFDLATAMARLPNAYKTILVLRFFEDLKITDIAEVLGENVNTVKTRLYKALELLKLEMREEAYE